ncbi:type VI secretion system baseplate subunit TssK [Aliikangiella coralliicola]|uniref:Type VI secretion system baseplate subunit TssK n=1 Tax=Aliikangiella coralliicola TaxID=2592383 RepID=A0A545U8S3_9GAMM|nr:type VI secretion system baseplate subunit TssK [Aliikangiella coralliicola]TQV85871.1 type VI secretion system baseplate subunit TssK [Aliikangiella coralliicola]
MSLDSKVVWSEGMFLNPHHFQQQDRYFERYINGKCSAYGAYGWGIHEIEIDQELLKLGKVSIISGRGVFPDGTPFSFPDQYERPAVLEVPENTHQKVVYLAIPVRRPGAVDVLTKNETQGLARYYSSKEDIRDVSFDGGETIEIDVGQLRLRLLLESDDRSGYATIGILKINEAREDKNVLLDDKYIPTCLDCSASQKLVGFLSELVGLLHHRGQSIAGRLADTQRGGTAEVADYLMLQMVNRLEPLAMHLSQMKGLHPLQLYTEVVQMIGEFSTFVAENKRPPALPPYLHDDLTTAFVPVMNSLRQCLSMVYEQTAVSLPLVEKKFGIRVAQIPDRSLLNNAMFILAVRADVPENTIRSQFPAQVKVGPVERIRQLVNAAMPGIPLKPLPVAPRQIPFHAGFNYFELERSNDFWKELNHSGGFAVHVGGDFPGLELEFWSIRL